MKLYILSIIIAILISASLIFNNYLSVKSENIKKEINEIKNNEVSLIDIRENYLKLHKFIESKHLNSLSKSAANEKMLNLLETLKKDFSIEIVEMQDKNNYFQVKINFYEKYKNNDRLFNFFNTLFNTDFAVPYIEDFEYKTTESGTEIRSLIKIIVPYKS
jgi:archaellum component FlaF (FlaF/FlaG flagellin family)